MTARKPPRAWPLFLIAAPAAVAVWSGWVGLGELSGFGIIHPLPGIWDAFKLNTAITLPVGVEAYGAFALGSWLRPGAPSRARTFARRSGIGSLCLGMLGQVTFHVLTAGHAHRAPWPVVVLVACLPVVTLGFGVALAHLLRAEADNEAEADTVTEPVTPSHPQVSAPAPESAPDTAPVSEADTAPESVPADAPEAVPATRPSAHRKPRTRTARGKRTRTAPVTSEQAEAEFMSELAAGEVPSLRQIRARLHVGQERAQALQAHMSALTTVSTS